MKTLKKMSIAFILFGIASFTLLSINSCNTSPTESNKKEIVIGVPQLKIGLPVFVAKEKGFFLKQGLNVKLQSYQTAQPMIDALISGNIELAGYAYRAGKVHPHLLITMPTPALFSS